MLIIMISIILIILLCLIIYITLFSNSKGITEPIYRFSNSKGITEKSVGLIRNSKEITEPINRFSSNLIDKWNYFIKQDCDKQDIDIINGIPSYHNAWDTKNKTIIQLHKLITINHDLILNEVYKNLEDLETIDNLSNFDNIYNSNNIGNKSIFIRYMNQWASTSDKIPTLKNIVSLFPDISNVNISIFYPGSIISEQKGPSKIFQKYHYGLHIPYEDIGLKIKGYNVNWINGAGFVWDDTLNHSIWNHTLKPRIVIFVDVLRKFSYFKNLGSKYIYRLLKK